MARIVDSVLVHNDRRNQPTKLDQSVPVATIAGETRGLDRQHGAHAARANRGQEALEAGPVGAAARAAEVLVDDLDRRPAELTSAVGKGILPAPALPVVNELVRRRLADIDIGTARKMLSRDLRHGRP